MFAEGHHHDDATVLYRPGRIQIRGERRLGRMHRAPRFRSVFYCGGGCAAVRARLPEAPASPFDKCHSTAIHCACFLPTADDQYKRLLSPRSCRGQHGTAAAADRNHGHRASASRVACPLACPPPQPQHSHHRERQCAEDRNK